MFNDPSSSVQLPMTERRRQFCLEITKQMMTYPCAQCFVEPVDPDETDYLAVIQSPQDLTTILSRLETKQYETVDLWEQDVNLIWYNAEKFNGTQSYYFSLASALAKRFQKIKRVIDIERLEKWTKEFYDLELKLNTLLKSAPDIIKGALPDNLVNDTKNTDFSEDEYSALDKALKLLSKPSDLLFLNNVLRNFAPKININNEPMSVDLRDLPNKALHLMKDYSMKRLQELGEPYPTKENLMKSNENEKNNDIHNTRSN